MEIRTGRTDSSANFYEDLKYRNLKPHHMLVSVDDADKVVDAVNTLEEFQRACEEQIEGFVQ